MTPDLDGGLALDEVAPLRPSLRGSIHRWATPVAVLLSMALVIRPHDGADRFVLGVYGACVKSMLAVSAFSMAGSFISALSLFTSMPARAASAKIMSSVTLSSWPSSAKWKSM